MIFPEPMKKAVIAVLEEEAKALSRALLDMGIVHFSRIGQPRYASRLGTVSEPVPSSFMADVRGRIENLLGTADGGFLEPELNIETVEPVDISKVTKRVDAISNELQEIRNRQGALQTEMHKLGDMQRQMEILGDVGKAVHRNSEYSFLNIRYGSVPEDRLVEIEDALRALSAITVPGGMAAGRATLLVVSMKRDQAAIEQVLGQGGWQDTEIPSEIDQVQQGLSTDFQTRIEGFRKEQSELEGLAKERIAETKPELLRIWANLKLNELLAQVRSYFSTTERTVLLSGWVPAKRCDDVEAAVAAVAHGSFFVEWVEHSKKHASENDSPPVKLENPKFLAPFQMLVQNFSTPSYGTIDPTPIVAITYLCMFGLMFADAGQGLILLLTGLLGQVIYRNRNQKKLPILDLIAWCGGTAIVAGVVFGSYFGFPLFPAIWFDYHGVVSGHVHEGVVNSVYGILGITIWFGIAVIALGIVLNLINRVAKRDWIAFVFDKGGLAGAWIFGAGVVFGTTFVQSGYRDLPAGIPLLLGIGLPVLLLAVKSPLMHRDAHGRGIFAVLMDHFMEWIVEVLEVFSGYLANVLSFMRVAGLGIAHASLMMAFDSIARSTSANGSYGIAAIVVLILGNVLVIALEGLSAGIQSLRLNYYEFFSKYFDGTGMKYSPVTLRSKSLN